MTCLWLIISLSVMQSLSETEGPQSPTLYVSYQSLLQTEIAFQEPILPSFVIALNNYFELKILYKAWL